MQELIDLTDKVALVTDGGRNLDFDMATGHPWKVQKISPPPHGYHFPVGEDGLGPAARGYRRLGICQLLLHPLPSSGPHMLYSAAWDNH